MLHNLLITGTNCIGPLVSQYKQVVPYIDATSFVESDAWLEDIAKLWVSIPEELNFLCNT